MADMLKTALIIEDDLDLSFMLKEIIKTKGFEVFVVHNLNDAKVLLQGYCPSIIVLDNTLPDGFGLNFAGYLEENYPRAKVLLMTGDYELTLNTEQMRSISKFIRKPFTLDQFRSYIEALI
jgi:DNA-binding NtrC family response regulator